jgi:RNA-directed DNA polymerase
LRAAYLALKRDAAAGVDGETWHSYGQTLEANLQDLSDRLKRGAYRARPVRRAYIPKADGRQRPLGVPAPEDKLVQRAVVEVLNAIYETAFLGFCYGFRPGCSPHHALDALWVGLSTKKVNWVLDVDIRGFFGAPGEAGRFQRVQLPPRQGERAALPGVEPWAHGGNDMGKRRQSDARAVTQVKRLSLVIRKSGGRQGRKLGRHQ